MHDKLFNFINISVNSMRLKFQFLYSLNFLLFNSDEFYNGINQQIFGSFSNSCQENFSKHKIRSYLKTHIQ